MCDALYMKVRENHRIVSKGVYIGIGIDSDGRRTILGFDVQDGESEDNGIPFFNRSFNEVCSV